MPYRVFAQAPNELLNLATLATNARRFFEASIEVLEERGLVQAPRPEDSLMVPWVRLRLTSVRRGFSGSFRVACRRAHPGDWDAARRAEKNGRATGMGILAGRCGGVWDIETEGPKSDPALLNLAALLASVALGPILPDDESTLFGIRGAMERVEAQTHRSLAR